MSVHVAILSNTLVENDPRVLRWACTLHDQGYHVTTIGRGQSKDCSLPWTHIGISGNDIRRDKSQWREHILNRLLRPSNYENSLFDSFTHFFQRAILLRCRSKGWKNALLKTLPILRKFESECLNLQDVKFWVANDWDTLSVAKTAKNCLGGKLIYDSHEFATGQFNSSIFWRLFTKPLVIRVEGACIGDADDVTSVSPGICAKLKDQYSLAKTPVCIRNIPEYVKIKPHETRGPLKILYQGIVGPGRGCEEMIKAIPLINRPVSFTIRGPETAPGYKSKLIRLSNNLGVRAQVIVADPVSPSNIISEASKSDIGVLFLSGSGPQSIHAMPNKLFEYMMAGLMVLINNMTDMAKIVSENNVGLVLKSNSAIEIATAINQLTPIQINAFKAESLGTSKKLNWENEKHKILSLMTN